MGGTCRAHGIDEKKIIKFWSENLKGRDHSEDLGVDGKIISDLTVTKSWASLLLKVLAC
jgi:hypothetical protein